MVDVDEIFDYVSRTKQEYIATFPSAEPKIEVYKVTYVSEQTIIRPDFSITPKKFTRADFYISKAEVDFTLNNLLQNQSFRNIRHGSDTHGIDLESHDIGNYSTSLPFTRRRSSSSYDLQVKKTGVWNFIKSLAEAFLTGWVVGEFNINASGCAFLICRNKSFYIKGTFPVGEVHVHW